MDAARVVTIMHVDVEGSTALTTRVGDEAAGVVLAETKRVVREQAQARGGRLIDEVGDAMMLTFGSPRAAISAAVAVQDALTERERGRPEESLRVRIGLNVGEVVDRNGTPFGAAVNAGARVMAKADGGEILVSEMVRRLAGTVPGIEYRDRGRHGFKGFDEPWRLYQLVWPGAPPPRPKPRRRLSRRLVVAGAAFAVALAAAAVAVALATRGGQTGLARLDRNTVGLLDAETGRILQQVRVGSDPRALAARGGSVWVANYGDQTVTRVVESTGETTTIAVRGHPIAIAAVEGGAWVLELEHRLVYVDRRFDRVSLSVPTEADRIAFGARSLWTSTQRAYVRRLDSRTGRPTGGVVAPDLGAGNIAVTRGAIWACGAALTPIDVHTNVPGQPIVLPGGCVSVAAAGGTVWCLARGFDNQTRIAKISASSGAVVTAKVPGNPTAITAAVDAAWLSDESAASVIRVSGNDLHDVRRIDVGAVPTAVAVGQRGVWVATS